MSLKKFTWRDFPLNQKRLTISPEIQGLGTHFAVFMTASGTHLETRLQQMNKEKVFQHVPATQQQKVFNYEKELDTTGKQFLATRQALKYLPRYLLRGSSCHIQHCLCFVAFISQGLNLRIQTISSNSLEQKVKKKQALKESLDERSCS